MQPAEHIVSRLLETEDFAGYEAAAVGDDMHLWSTEHCDTAPLWRKKTNCKTIYSISFVYMIRDHDVNFYLAEVVPGKQRNEWHKIVIPALFADDYREVSKKLYSTAEQLTKLVAKWEQMDPEPDITTAMNQIRTIASYTLRYTVR